MNTHMRMTGAIAVASLAISLSGCSTSPAAEPAGIPTAPAADQAIGDTSLGMYIVEPTLQNFSACTDITAVVRVVSADNERIGVEIVDVLKGSTAAGDVITIVDPTPLGGADEAANLIGGAELLVTLAASDTVTDAGLDYFLWGAHVIGADGALTNPHGLDTVSLDAASAPATLADARAVVASVIADGMGCPAA